MRWKKVGLIFNVDGTLDWAQSHASVPFAYNIKQSIFRIYFSSRDLEGKSRPGFFEIDLDHPTQIENITGPLLELGALGQFDDAGVMPCWITKDGLNHKLYYIGWNQGKSVPFRNSIGRATSGDGIHFSKEFAGPILDRGIHDPCFTASCCVLIESGVWKMWYLSCVSWEMKNGKPEHRYHIKYAESDDGIEWRRSGVVCIDFSSSDEYAISRPSVIKDQSGYKMWYSYRGSHYSIGYAESFDGINWIRKDAEAGIDVSVDGWDSEMIEYPHVLSHGRKLYMFYNGNGYGKSGIGLAVIGN